MCKKFYFIFLIIFTGFVSEGKEYTEIIKTISNEDSITIIKKEYKVSMSPCPLMTQVSYEIKNNSSKPYLAWINNTSVSGWDNRTKAVRYFLKDFDPSLFMHTVLDVLEETSNVRIGYFIPIVGKTLVKLIKPHSSFFIINAYKYNNPNPNPDLENRIVVMEKNETEKYLGFVNSHLREKFFFRPDVLFIPHCETE